MKLLFAGITLFVATIALGMGCGPKEKYCYEDMDTCAHVKAKIEADAMWEAEPDADALAGHCYDNNGVEIPCGG